jgi:formylglycine-generating enzyme required for sulfatase activity
VPTRRHALRRLGLASAAAFLGRALAHGQAAAFAGVQAGEARAVEDIAFRWCPPGRFTMGSPPGEERRRADEAQVEVTLSHGFWMAAHETTQGEWRRIHGAPTERPLSDAFGLGDDVPVYWVSYHAANAYCEALTARARGAGTLPAGWACRLPTEAQWEYACRAGTTTATAFGDRLRRGQANFLLDPALDGDGPPAPRRATRVGTFPANAWGLHEMHGNVFEWCRDWYHATLPGGVDPDVQVKGEPNRDGSYSRVRRGGAWNDPAHFCRSAFRLRYEPERSSDHIGFRVALVTA